MNGRRGVLGAALAAVALGAPLAAEAQTEAEVMATIEQVFDGMRTANSDMVRDAFAENARFAVLDSRDGPTVIRSQGVDGWIDGIANSEGKWDEQIYDVEIKVDGPMASAWTPYTFYLDGTISHCGINSIEMLHDGNRWKVTQLSDTRRRQGCPDPHGVGS